MYRSIRFGGLVLLIAMVGASSACSNPSPTGEGQTGTRSQPATEDQASPTGDSEMKPGAPSKNSASVNILGFELGGAYQDALSAAGAQLELREDTPEDHRGKGRLHGMGAALTLAGRHGRLVDIQLKLQLDQADEGLESSQPYARLEAELGTPSEVSGDVASWERAGLEVTLQRHSVWAKGEDAPRIEYTLRSRTTPLPSGSADPVTQEAKEREAGQ